mmetsp:Transcript_21687/g.69919  ORF Transcript_21687/g.69919 Transcript_21687/m.69919 type:complete len:355 (-) Transcript_21687:44-1108(-)
MRGDATLWYVVRAVVRSLERASRLDSGLGHRPQASSAWSLGFSARQSGHARIPKSSALYVHRAQKWCSQPAGQATSSERGTSRQRAQGSAVPSASAARRRRSDASSASWSTRAASTTVSATAPRACRSISAASPGEPTCLASTATRRSPGWRAASEARLFGTTDATTAASSNASEKATPTAAAAAAFHTISILEPRRCRHRRCSFRAESATKTGGLRSSRMRTQPCASRIIAAASRAVRGLSPLIARMRSNVLMMGASEPSERRCAASEPGNTVRTVGCAGHERISEMPIRIPARGLNTSTTSSGPPAVAAPSPPHDIGLVAPRSSPGDSSPLLLLADEGHRGQVRRIDVSNMG